MSLAQSNFDHARDSGRPTLRALWADAPISLSDQHRRTLETWAWDLEAIQAAIRIELDRRYAAPMDVGI